MYKEDLALNNLQWLICLKTKPNKPNSLSLSFSLHLILSICIHACVCMHVYHCVFVNG